MKLSCTLDTAPVVAAFTRPVAEAIAEALKKAGSSAVKSMKVEANRQIRARKKLGVSFVNDRIAIIYSDSAAGDALTWKLKVSGKAIPLAEFPYRQTKKGVTVQVNADGGRKLVPHTFEATVGSGHVGIFRRAGKQRLPIKELYSSRLTDVLSEEDVLAAVKERGAEVFRDGWHRLVPAALQGVLGKGRK